MTAEEIAKAIGAAISTARVAAGIATQQDLATMIGAHTSAVSRYETGRSRPADDVLMRIEAALNLRKGQILIDAGLVDMGKSTDLRQPAARASQSAKSADLEALVASIVDKYLEERSGKP